MGEDDKPADRVHIEPHAEIRAAAATAMQIYTAYLEVGFTPFQALQLLMGIEAQGGKQ